MFFLLGSFTDFLGCPVAPADLAPQYGADGAQAEPGLWLLGDEGAARDGRLRARLPVPAPCRFCHPPVPHADN